LNKTSVLSDYENSRAIRLRSSLQFESFATNESYDQKSKTVEELYNHIPTSQSSGFGLESGNDHRRHQQTSGGAQ